MNTKKLARIMIVGLFSLCLASCATVNKSIVGVSGEEFGIVGKDKQAADIPNGYFYMSGRVLDQVVEGKIKELK